MIKFWLHRRGFVKLLELLWFHDTYTLYDIKIGTELLSKGYRI